MAADFELGAFQVRPSERRVYAGGRPVTLGSRAFDLLLVLIEHRHRTVGKEELLALVWPGMVVEEGNLAVHVSALRKLLGVNAIATIPGRGYRFTAAVAEAPPGPAQRLSEAGDSGRRIDIEPSPSGVQQAAYEQVMRKLLRPAGGSRPAPQAAEETAGWLPAASTPLLGRTCELGEMRLLLPATRCLTLTGAGGSGKTRLALALAESVRADYAASVWWVELDRLADPALLAAAIAHTLGLSDPYRPPLPALIGRLKGRKALLVLDNCEHLVAACAELAVQLLRELPSLQVLATSRESLRIAGEVAWCVPPLDVPAAESPWDRDALMQHAAVQLLVQRIRQHEPRFALTQANAASLVRICRELDGLPLALELVAAQVGPMTLEQVAARLDRSLGLLSVGERGGMRHHQTMAAAVDWGFRLLDATDSAVFLRLAVFAGGWTHESAEAVCAGLALAADDMPAVLGRLHRVSMVAVSQAGEEPRFRMLEPIRQFALSKLEALGQADAVKRQLLAWYVERSQSIAALMAGPQQAEGYRFLSAEFANLRALLSWSLQCGPAGGAPFGAADPLQAGAGTEFASGLRLAAGLWRFWQVKGHAKEMLAWFEQALPRAGGVEPALRADACNAAGVMARTCGRYDKAVSLHEAALALQRELGHRRGEAVALNNLCVVARDRYDHAAVERHGRASLLIARAIGDSNLEGLGLMHLGTALRGQGRWADAEDSFRRSFEIFTALGEKRALAALHNFLGNLALARGHWPEAAHCFDQGLACNEALGDFWGLGISFFNQASLLVAQGDHDGAWPVLMQGFAHYRQAGVRHGVDECFELLACIAGKRGQPERAAWCWGLVEKLEQDMGKVLSPQQQAVRELSLQAVLVQLPPDSFQAALAAGRCVALEDAYTAVLALGGAA